MDDNTHHPFLIVSRDEIELESNGMNDRFLGYLDLNASAISNVSYLKSVSSNIKNRNENNWNETVKKIYLDWNNNLLIRYIQV